MVTDTDHLFYQIFEEPVSTKIAPTTIIIQMWLSWMFYYRVVIYCTIEVYILPQYASIMLFIDFIIPDAGLVINVRLIATGCNTPWDMYMHTGVQKHYNNPAAI